MMHNKKENTEEIKPKFESCFIKGEIPKTGHQNLSLKWFSTDIESQNYYMPYNEEINYKFNSHGYRCEEFKPFEGLKILTLGCSFSFGNGIPVNKRFSAIFCALLSEKTGSQTIDWNLSWPGSSGDYASRIAQSAIPILKPDVVLVNFPHSSRREYFDINGEIFQFRPDRKPKTPKDKDFLDHHLGLTSHYQDAYNLLKNYKIIKNLCFEFNSRFIYSILKIDKNTYNLIKQYFDETELTESQNKIDVSRDGGHLGVNSHNNHGQNYFNSYIRKYND